MPMCLCRHGEVANRKMKTTARKVMLRVFRWLEIAFASPFLSSATSMTFSPPPPRIVSLSSLVCLISWEPFLILSESFFLVSDIPFPYLPSFSLLSYLPLNLVIYLLLRFKPFFFLVLVLLRILSTSFCSLFSCFGNQTS